MNIKNLKALKEAEVYPDDMLRGMEYLVEDLPEGERDKCMPYNSYPIPRVEDLIVMLTEYQKEDEIAVKIDAQMTMMGFMMYNVVVNPQDSQEFDSPFLDDALAEAVLWFKGRNK